MAQKGMCIAVGGWELVIYAPLVPPSVQARRSKTLNGSTLVQ